MQGGINAFQLSIESGYLDVEQYLESKMGEHLYDTDDEGHTLLHQAVQKGQLSLVKYLVESYNFDLAKTDKVYRTRKVTVCTCMPV